MSTLAKNYIVKKLFVALVTLTAVSCHTSPYVFDIPKILAMDARKLPEMLGNPYQETLPGNAAQNNSDGTARYVYRKPEHTINVYFNYNTGIITDITAVKIISGSDVSNIDTVKEKAELTSKLNLTSIYITNYKISPIEILNGPKGHKFVRVIIHLKE